MNAFGPVSEFTVADMKAIMAKYGQPVQPDAKITRINKPKPGAKADVILLDRVQEGTLPEYCTHGYATCVRCDHPCWIGHNTEKALLAGRGLPLCLDCARETIPAGATATENLRDHRRADGPHA